MRIFVTVLVISTMVLSGCGNSSANPRNWFGKKKAQRTVQTTDSEAAEQNPLIPDTVGIFESRRKQRTTYEGVPVDQISNLVIERTSSGAIVRVTGVSLRQGAHDVRLTSDTKGEPKDGVLTLTLKALQFTNTRQGPERTRVIKAARHVSANQLEKIRVIQVVAARNSLTINP